MEFIDTLIAGIAPTFAVRRLQAKASVKAYYEASRPSRTRKNAADNNSGNVVAGQSSEVLRGQARHLEQNHDLARGALRELTNKTVGAKGVQVESLARTESGELAGDFAKKINDLWKEWCIKCDTTGEFSFAQAQRMLANSKYRDGEAFSRLLQGNVPDLDHNTDVPLSIQMIEADLVPFITDPSKRLYQGIRCNQWGRPIEYNVLAHHPSESYSNEVFCIASKNMNPLKSTDRIGQRRGVSIFASVINRLNDLKDYEDAERVAAKISASMAAFIKKGTPDLYDDDSEEDRSLDIQNGMVFDGLEPGEDIGTIQSNRPSQLLQGFRDSMLKAVSTGTGAGYSPISNDYSGTYSSQRQQLVDNWISYEVLQQEFIDEIIRPTYRRFVQMVIANKMVSLKGVDRATIFDADYRAPVMPWIDPKKEADAHVTRLAAGLVSPQKIMRQAGESPQEVIDQMKAYVDMLNAADLQKPEYLQPTDQSQA
jgi:lambda family phage portal protein